MAAKQWNEIAAEIMGLLQTNIVDSPELKPLLTSVMNFDRKYCGQLPADGRHEGTIPAIKLSKVLNCFEQAGLVVMEKESYDRLVQTVEQQSEEIDLLDERIKRLLEH
ncbi:hypothetical protein GMST_35050 [Geomonas silvestris]|uniref:Uncharacterized protein n=1 Tax=Geomonas silvestris TaxID=2740184 RepID=A0A6V8MMG9_9BACT|nr:hypothetical protein [Geomonas silvestris]GFO61180.1 hypothetical protein GMST_35050 [Geomonas silvestris]